MIRQSSIIAQSVCTGPSRNARSSGASRASGTSWSIFQSGPPRKSSPSHQTVPASIAVRSVSDIGGSTARTYFRSGRLTKRCLRVGTLNSTAATTNSVVSTPPATPPSQPNSDATTSTAPIARVATIRLGRVRASRTRVASATASQKTMPMSGSRTLFSGGKVFAVGGRSADGLHVRRAIDRRGTAPASRNADPLTSIRGPLRRFPTGHPNVSTRAPRPRGDVPASRSTRSRVGTIFSSPRRRSRRRTARSERRARRSPPGAIDVRRTGLRRRRRRPAITPPR